jgi:hypothetical protein
MRKAVLVVTGVLITLLCNSSFSHGQKQTERFIPLGQSPGISGKYTTIGKIQAVNGQSRTLVIANESGTYTVKITDRTKIWLDRSKSKLSTIHVSMTDLKPGNLAEVKYEDENTHIAEWIKVQAAE